MPGTIAHPLLACPPSILGMLDSGVIRDYDPRGSAVKQAPVFMCYPEAQCVSESMKKCDTGVHGKQSSV